MTSERPTVALFGASVRWLAQSAHRAGFQVFGCDLFNDEDLLSCCERVARVEPGDYPDGFRKVADEWPGVPRVYTGGLENYPHVVEHLAEGGPLWGCAPEALRACREPTALRACGFETPAVALDGAGVPTDGSWLLKSKVGSAGRGIRPWAGGELRAESFLQRRIDGEPCSAAFVALEDRTVLVGAAAQFIGEAWTGAPSFAYAGGIAPLDLSRAAEERLFTIGEGLRMRFSLSGLFGVDAVRNGDDWAIIEINPRPTASTELFEAVGMGSIFAMQHQAFAAGNLLWSRRRSATLSGGWGRRQICGGSRAQDHPPTLPSPAAGGGIETRAGKAIVYATAPCRLEELLAAQEEEWAFADRPARGTVFKAGEPVATVLAVGESREVVTERLKRGADQLRRRLTRK